ncbi:MAG: hypothetical protein QW638_04235 [Candidatus Bathyarchaeia archaeon]|nr:hypothetical protein [Candidatus Bathyarchaeota archaeon]
MGRMIGNSFKKKMVEFKKRFMRLDIGKVTLTLGSAFVSFIIGLRLLEIITFDTEFLTNSIMLFVLGTVLLVEALKSGVKSIRNTSVSILIALALSAYITGFFEILSGIVEIVIPPRVFGAIGLLYIILSVIIIIGIWK